MNTSKFNSFLNTNLIFQSKIKNKKFFLFLALTYGYFLSQFSDSKFSDFDNYLIYAESSQSMLITLLLQSNLTFFFNEPVWLLINALLAILLEPDSIVRLIIFLSSFSTVWILLNHNPKFVFYILLFLILPNVIKNNIIHLRQGAAIAFFLWGWFSKSMSFRWIYFFIAAMIHVSFYFVIFFYVLASILRSIHLNPNFQIFIYLIVSIAVGLSIGGIVQFTGARQGDEYIFQMADTSGFGFILWLVIFCIFISAGADFLRAHSLEAGIIIFYLVSYWMIEVTARIFESGLMLVLLAGLSLTGLNRQFFLFVVICSGVYSWISRISMPSLGF